MQHRLKSKVFWAAIVAQIISIGQLAGIWKSLGVDTGLIGDITAGILQLLVMFGLLNDPTNPSGF